MRGLKHLAIAVLACAKLCLQAAEPSPIEDFGLFPTWPILDDGRKMPIDSYARNTLLRYSGKSTMNKEPAIEWLARVLFTPGTTTGDPLFLINNPGIAQDLEIPEQESRRYSFTDLEPALQRLAMKTRSITSKEAPSDFDKELLRIDRNVRHYVILVNAFAWTRPHADFTVGHLDARKALNLPEAPTLFSFAEIHEKRALLDTAFESLDPDNVTGWSEKDQVLYRTREALRSWNARMHSQPFALVPVAAHTGEETWMSPADALGWNFPDERMIKAIAGLRKAATAYVLRDADSFRSEGDAWMSYVLERKGSDREVLLSSSEVSYNNLHAFGRALSWTIPAFLLGLLAVVFDNRWFRRGATLLLVVGLAFQLTGLAWRIYLTARPPVTNLYGSFLFVAALVALLGVIVEWRQRNGLGVFTSALGSTALLLIANRFGADGDTMAKVVAVLDSNFWLATHVIAITTGYAGVWLAGVIGHVYLLALAFGKKPPAWMRSVFQSMMGLLAFGWAFSFLGTMLGGVWADQSWGRFWGWDPKENGALLIVIWVAALYHARMGNMIRERGMALGAVFGCVIVMAAWLGVNLMGVGLHNYGFTSGLARGLLLYAGLEALFMVVLALKTWPKKQ